MYLCIWCARLESNQRPLASEANTLSTELRAHDHAFTGWCAMIILTPCQDDLYFSMTILQRCAHGGGMGPSASYRKAAIEAHRTRQLHHDEPQHGSVSGALFGIVRVNSKRRAHII